MVYGRERWGSEAASSSQPQTVRFFGPLGRFFSLFSPLSTPYFVTVQIVISIGLGILQIWECYTGNWTLKITITIRNWRRSENPEATTTWFSFFPSKTTCFLFNVLYLIFRIKSNVWFAGWRICWIYVQREWRITKRSWRTSTRSTYTGTKRYVTVWKGADISTFGTRRIVGFASGSRKGIWSFYLPEFTTASPSIPATTSR